MTTQTLSTTNSLETLLQDEANAWKLIKLPQAGPQEMEKIHGRMSWTDALHCSPTITKKPNLLDQMGEMEQHMLINSMSESDAMAYAMSEMGSDDAFSAWEQNHMALIDSEDIQTEIDMSNPPLLANPAAFIAAMADLNK